MGIVDLAFIGRIGKTELGAAALGNTMFYLMHYPMLGVMTAIDTLLATTFGAGHLRAYSDWTQTARGRPRASRFDLMTPVQDFLISFPSA